MNTPAAPPATDWESVDWTRSNAAIARDLGVTREAVRQRRLDAGMLPLRKLRALENRARDERIIQMARTKTAQQISTAMGLHIDTIWAVLGRAGVLAKKPARPPHVKRLGWDRLAPEDWARLTNGEIADMLGASINTVRVHRSRHNKPPSPTKAGQHPRKPKEATP